jgi:hypothetical protein
MHPINTAAEDELWNYFVQQLKARRLYVDVHTTKYPAPAAILRSQIYPSGRNYGNVFTCPHSSFSFKHPSAKEQTGD